MQMKRKRESVCEIFATKHVIYRFALSNLTYSDLEVTKSHVSE